MPTDGHWFVLAGPTAERGFSTGVASSRRGVAETRTMQAKRQARSRQVEGMAMGSLALVAACSSHSEGQPRSPGVDGGSEVAADASSSDGATGIASDAGLADAFGRCATSIERGVPTPVDVAFIIDTSGSMSDLIVPGQSKWAAVVSALSAFVNDPASSGLGVGITYFPTPVSGAAASCSTNQMCGQAGPCLLGVCNDANEDACASDSDCAAAVTCVPVGTCANDANSLCISYGMPCGADSNGFDLGTCGNPLTTSYCANGDSCEASDYAQPVLPITPLPGAANAFVASLQNRQPAGSTPTQAALQGALDGAQAYADSHPGNTVVAVLATDGAPDEAADPSTGLGLCTQVTATQADTQIAQAAAAAYAGTPSIQTFAIGVFTPDDAAAGTAALDPIATSGGSGSPFIIGASSPDAGAGVAAQFLDALTRIRAASLPCQFALPSAAGSANFNELNVSTTSGTGAVTTSTYVETSTACSPSAGGWYYNTDPAEGGTPTTIDLCPATCTGLKGDPQAQVSIVVGCQTMAQ